MRKKFKERCMHYLWKREQNTRSFWFESVKGRNHLKDLGKDGRIMSNRKIIKQDESRRIHLPQDTEQSILVNSASRS